MSLSESATRSPRESTQPLLQSNATLASDTWALPHYLHASASQAVPHQQTVAGRPDLNTPFKISRPAGQAPQRASKRGAGKRQSQQKMTGGHDFETDSIDESDSSATSIAHGRSAAAGGVNPKLQRWSKFVRNLYEMTVSPENALAIGFSADGYCLEIRDPKLLSGEVLHRYFKHSNVSSFIRQLNNYGFRTIPTVMNRAVAHCFAHESFQRDRLDKLCNVRRRVPGSEAAQAAAPIAQPEELTAATSSRDTEMEARLMQLTHMNDQLKRQNYELHEENKRLRANWRSSHDSAPQRSSSVAGMRAQHHQMFPDMHQQQHQQQQQQHQMMRHQQQQSMHNAQVQSSSSAVDVSSGAGGNQGYGAAYQQKARPPYPGAPSYPIDTFGHPQGFFLDPNAAVNELFGMAGTPHLPPGPFWSDE